MRYVGKELLLLKIFAVVLMFNSSTMAWTQKNGRSNKAYITCAKMLKPLQLLKTLQKMVDNNLVSNKSWLPNNNGKEIYQKSFKSFGGIDVNKDYSTKELMEIVQAIIVTPDREFNQTSREIGIFNGRNQKNLSSKQFLRMLQNIIEQPVLQQTNNNFLIKKLQIRILKYSRQIDDDFAILSTMMSTERYENFEREVLATLESSLFRDSKQRPVVNPIFKEKSPSDEVSRLEPTEESTSKMPVYEPNVNRNKVLIEPIPSTSSKPNVKYSKVLIEAIPNNSNEPYKMNNEAGVKPFEESTSKIPTYKPDKPNPVVVQPIPNNPNEPYQINNSASVKPFERTTSKMPVYKPNVKRNRVLIEAMANLATELSKRNDNKGVKPVMKVNSGRYKNVPNAPNVLQPLRKNVPNAPKFQHFREHKWNVSKNVSLTHASSKQQKFRQIISQKPSDGYYKQAKSSKEFSHKKANKRFEVKKSKTITKSNVYLKSGPIKSIKSNLQNVRPEGGNEFGMRNEGLYGRTEAEDGNMDKETSQMNLPNKGRYKKVPQDLKEENEFEMRNTRKNEDLYERTEQEERNVDKQTSASQINLPNNGRNIQIPQDLKEENEFEMRNTRKNEFEMRNTRKNEGLYERTAQEERDVDKQTSASQMNSPNNGRNIQIPQDLNKENEFEMRNTRKNEGLYSRTEQEERNLDKQTSASKMNSPNNRRYIQIPQDLNKENEFEMRNTRKNEGLYGRTKQEERNVDKQTSNNGRNIQIPQDLKEENEIEMRNTRKNDGLYSRTEQEERTMDKQTSASQMNLPNNGRNIQTPQDLNKENEIEMRNTRKNEGLYERTEQEERSNKGRNIPQDSKEENGFEMRNTMKNEGLYGQIEQQVGYLDKQTSASQMNSPNNGNFIKTPNDLNNEYEFGMNEYEGDNQMRKNQQNGLSKWQLWEYSNEGPKIEDQGSQMQMQDYKSTEGRTTSMLVDDPELINDIHNSLIDHPGNCHKTPRDEEFMLKRRALCLTKKKPTHTKRKELVDFLNYVIKRNLVDEELRIAKMKRCSVARKTKNRERLIELREFRRTLSQLGKSRINGTLDEINRLYKKYNI